MGDPGLDDNNKQETGESFVRERIVNRPSKRRLFRKLLVTGACAVLFGLVAGITIAAVFPVASGWFATEETPPAVTIPKDTQGATNTEESTAAPENSTEISGSGTDGAETGTEIPPESTTGQEILSEEDIREMIQAALREQASDPATLQSLYRALANLGKEYTKAVVTVVTGAMGTDWFENEFQTSGESVGILWNEAEDGSLYVLTCAGVPEEGTEIRVILCDGTRVDAEFCQADSQVGIMVLKIPGTQVDDNIRGRISVLPLGNSYRVMAGQPMVIVGNPIGEMGAVVPGVITYTNGEYEVVDSIYREHYLNCSTVEGSTGFVISLEGEILGLITPDTSGNITRAVGISELKGVLELLANGKPVPYLGVMGKTVTTDLAATYSLPVGVYVNEVITESPVYHAGIKAGDVIVKVGSETIATVRGLGNAVEGLEPGTEVTVTVMRAGNGEYQELQFTMVPGLR